jgi:serine/threonine-protein kinase
MSPSSTESRVIGRYALDAPFARGGMATIHFGRLMGAAGFTKVVAVKRLFPHLAEDPEFSAMLIDEARLAGRIQHPNVAATLDVVSEDGELLVVMEYIEGVSLEKLLARLRQRGGSVPVPIAGAIVTGVLYGLHAAHEARSERGEPLGIIHRDVSPPNIIVSAGGVARVVDFGVAKAAGRLQVTRPGQLKGKLCYMAPEQLRGASVQRGVDVYAASVVLWECLTGKRLHEGVDERRIVKAITSGSVELPSRHVAGIPAELDAIVLRGLAVRPEVRFSTALEMAAALEDLVPPATPRQVAAWLEDLAGDTLREHVALLAAVGSETQRPSTDIPSVEPEDVSNATTRVFVQKQLARLVRPPRIHALSEPSITVGYTRITRRRRLGALGAALAAAAVLAAAVALVMFSRRLSEAGAAEPAADPAVAIAPTIVASTAPEEEPAAEPSAAAEPEPEPEPKPEPAATHEPEPVAEIVAQSAAPVARKAPVPRRAAARASSPPKSASKPSAACNPPYVFQNGVKRLKAECL